MVFTWDSEIIWVQIFFRDRQLITTLTNGSDRDAAILCGAILEEISKIGYSKSLKGIRPLTIEGKIVSDADMCDAVGVNGIIRTYTYSLKNNMPFFDKNIFPVEDVNANNYIKKCSDSSVCHMFEKILKLKKLMLTDSGRQEIDKRHQITIDILYQLFDEEDAKDWKEYLDNFLRKHYNIQK